MREGPVGFGRNSEACAVPWKSGASAPRKGRNRLHPLGWSRSCGVRNTGAKALANSEPGRGPEGPLFHGDACVRGGCASPLERVRPLRVQSCVAAFVYLLWIAYKPEARS
jgi:hypothetical protein